MAKVSDGFGCGASQTLQPEAWSDFRGGVGRAGQRVTLFEKTPILCALQAIDGKANFAESANQLIIFDL